MSLEDYEAELADEWAELIDAWEANIVPTCRCFDERSAKGYAWMHEFCPYKNGDRCCEVKA